MAGIYYADLLDVLRAAGVTCRENATTAGWQTRARSSGGFPAPPLAVWWHHTASSTSPENDLSYMIDGSPDAPVGNLLLDRDGVVWPIAAGASNCAGKGGPATFSRGTCPVDQGNTRGWQCEAANAGTGEVWPVAQIDAFFRVSNALNAHVGNLPTDVITHQSWAPTRKIDPARADAVAGPWRPRSCSSSDTWELADIAAECARRYTEGDDDMPSADEVAQAVWSWPIGNQVAGTGDDPAWVMLRAAHADANSAAAAAGDLEHYELSAEGFTDAPGDPAVFWNGIRQVVRDEVRAALADAGLTDTS